MAKKLRGPHKFDRAGRTKVCESVQLWEKGDADTNQGCDQQQRPKSETKPRANVGHDVRASVITCFSPVTNVVTGCLTYSDGLRVDLKTYSDLFSRTCQQLPDLFSPEAKLIIPCPCCILRHGKTVWGQPQS